MFKVINFFVLWPICPSFSFVRFKNSPEYLTRGNAQVKFDEISAAEFGFENFSIEVHFS